MFCEYNYESKMLFQEQAEQGLINYHLVGFADTFFATNAARTMEKSE